MRKGSPIGEYRIDVSQRGKFTVADITTTIKVDVLFLTAYQLSQKGREIWLGDKFISYKGQTNDNGKMHVVSIAAAPNDTVVISNGRRAVAPKGAIPASLWNKQFLDQSVLINPSDGAIVEVKVVDMGSQMLMIDGAQELTKHYHIDGMKRDVWMVDGEPVKFQLIGSDNSKVVSELQPS